MHLSDVFDSLTHGELGHLFEGGEGEMGIQPCDYAKITSRINLGLSELYKRFPLKTGDVVVRMMDPIQTYYLDPRFSHTNDDSDIPIERRYIHDSEYQPFVGGVNKIEQVFNELGETLFLNDKDEYWSVFTPAYNAVQVPWPDKANQIIINYRADHDPIIIIPDLDPEKTEVKIPYAYLEALLYYVGMRSLTPMGGEEVQEGNNYMAKFEQSCAQLTNLNMMNTDNTRNSKLDKAGWV